MSDFPDIVELNVGGVFYTTSLATLKSEPESLLGQIFTGKTKTGFTKDSKGKYFLDRDGVLFRYVLDYLRNQKLVLPESFQEKERLRLEAEYFQLPDMAKCITQSEMNKNMASMSMNHVGNSEGGKESGCIVVGYRGTFAFGRDGLADVKFRKLSRILVSGRVSLCREAFQENLNESRDPDRGTSDRYTSRYFLKSNALEQAFDQLLEAGFRLSSCCGTGTNAAGDIKPGSDSEENKWNHYNEFIFIRP